MKQSRLIRYFTGTLILLCSLFFATATSIHAQLLSGPLDAVQLTPSVDNPVPGQPVTITTQSYSNNVAGAHFTWTVNGEVASSAIGQTTFTVTAPPLGKKLNIVLTVTTVDGKILNGSLSLGSGVVDMILETDGYVPTPFQGKILPSYQNTVKIVAIPHLANSSGVEYNPKSLVYTWKKDGNVMLDQSGYGRESAAITGDLIPRSYLVTVDVATTDGIAVSEGNVNVDQGSPTIDFYINDPLYGPLYNRSIGTSVSIGSQNETTVLAVPYGFNGTNNTTDLSYSWTVNGADQSSLDGNSSIILHAPDNSAGSSDIGLTVANSARILQGTDSAFTVYFSNTTGRASTTPITF